MVLMNEYLRERMKMMKMDETNDGAYKIKPNDRTYKIEGLYVGPQKEYTKEEMVKVYRAAIEQGKKQGAKDVIDAATTLASGFTELRNIMEEMYDNKPKPIPVDEPYSFELEWIDEILKRK